MPSADSQPNTTQKAISMPTSSNPSPQLQSAAYYSILSGTYASLASVLGKLSTDPRTFIYFQKFTSNLIDINSTDPGSLGAISEKLSTVFRLGFFIAMFLVNGSMWTCYTRALDMAVSSIQVVVLNNAVNMLVTAAFGYFLFDESVTLLWWFGASLVVTGTVLISRQTKSDATLTPPTDEQGSELNSKLKSH